MRRHLLDRLTGARYVADPVFGRPRFQRAARFWDGFVEFALTGTSIFLVAVSACAPHQSYTALPLPSCFGEPRPPLVFLPSSVDLGTVRGRLLASDDRRPLRGAYVELHADSSRLVTTDTNGYFQFDHVAPGRYTLNSVSLGHPLGTDTIVVPLDQRELEIVLRPYPSDPQMCLYERELAAEPALTLTRPESATVEHTTADGARLRHTVVAHATTTQLVLDSRITNIGSVPATITNLCYPSAAASVLRHFNGIGPTCYGNDVTLLPGHTMAVVTGGPLRGQPGRYQFRVHAVDPAAVDVTLFLNLVFSKR